MSNALGPFFELFQPGRRFQDEEEQRRRMEIVQTPSSNPAKGPIDLDSGIVVLPAAVSKQWRGSDD